MVAGCSTAPHFQEVHDFLTQHQHLCSWRGIAKTVTQMLGMGGRIDVGNLAKDQYGELGEYLHRLSKEQQCLE